MSYNLRFKVRSLASLPASEESEDSQIRFLVGTTTLREENEIHVVEYSEASNDLTCLAVLSHPNELWSITPCPADPSLMFTTYSQAGKSNASLWRVPIDAIEERATHKLEMEECLRIKTPSNTVWSVLWDPNICEGHEGPMSVISVESHHLRQWTIGEDGSSAAAAAIVEMDPDSEPFTAASWDPHWDHLVATGHGRNVSIWDLRSSNQTVAYSIPNAHRQRLRSMDHNPDRLYTLATAGQDGCIKFWDVRQPAAPLASMSNHSHWVTNVKYNRFYDQLVVSAGTDGVVCEHCHG
eukprot:TRINITY_DN2796_c0_g1_i4.p1 TRINITY_DN2796_c0_g1~~TRINITY_DN2796_c0_g1_i4.p1  ORF type:complete len:295 (+),score=52.84 TRINITY_DN2796_c0_g1_i4:247-1131(+)